jgi:hypothetical protein
MNSDRETQVFDFPNIWSEVRSELLKGQSVLLSAPRHWGKNTFCIRLENDSSILARFAIVIIHPNAIANVAMALKKIWKDVASQLQSADIGVTERFLIDGTWMNVRHSKKILFIIKINVGNKAICIKLLSFLQQLSHDHPGTFSKHFSLLVLDDLSLFFYEIKIRGAQSFLDIFESKKKIF